MSDGREEELSRLITIRLEQKHPVGEISKDTGLSIDCIYNYRRNLLKYGSIKAPRGHRPKKFDDEQEDVSHRSYIVLLCEKRHSWCTCYANTDCACLQAIIEHVILKPTIYLDELAEYALIITNLRPSTALLSRFLKKYGITRKKLSRKAIQRNEELRGA